MRNFPNDHWESWPRPLVLAHRGAWGKHPENTLEAFLEASNQGVAGIELDIQISGSGDLVVFHDWNLLRMAGKSLRIAQTTLKDLRDIRLPGGARIPSLKQVLDTLPAELIIDIEIKWGWPWKFPMERQLLELIQDRTDQKRVLISSFNPMVIRSLSNRSHRPPLALIFSQHKAVPFFLRKGQARDFSRCDIIKPHKDLLDTEAPYWKENLGILPWGVETHWEADSLLEKGVLGLISDHSCNLQKALSEKESELVP